MASPAQPPPHTADGEPDDAAPDELIAPDCPLCGEERRQVVHSQVSDVNLGHPGLFDIVQCVACAARYIDPQPVGDTLGAYYANTDRRAYPNHQVGADLHLPPAGTGHLVAAELGYPTRDGAAPDAAATRAARAWLDDPDRRWRVPPWTGAGRLLDVGCGTGSYLAAMKALGWDVTGVDLFDDVARAVSERHGVPVQAGRLPELDLPDGGFDVVTMWHMIEHAPDPCVLVARARELLADGGLLLMGVPVYDSDEEALLGGSWLGYDVPRHLFTFSRERLRTFLEGQGFTVDWVRSEPAPWILKQGAKVAPMGFVRRQLLSHRVTREWIARRQAAADRSGKVVALARKA
jgi:SAM-dependent methyltransferase